MPDVLRKMVAWPAAGKAKEHNFKQFDVHRSGTITKCPQVFRVTRASLAEDTASETEPPADEGASQNNDDEEPVPNYVSQLEVGMRSTFVRHHLTSFFGCACLFLIHYGYPCRHMIAVYKRLGFKLPRRLLHFLWRTDKERHAS